MEDKFLNGRGLKEYTAKVKEKMAFIEDPTTAGVPPSLINLFYPVGSIYISMDSSFDPNNVWGGTWSKIEAGRFIEATTTAANVGTNVAAGLPNIKGTIQTARSAHSIQSVNGAFSASSMVGSTKPAGESGAGDWILDFKASNSNPIYSDSVTTVQPKSIRAYVWRRTA